MCAIRTNVTIGEALSDTTNFDLVVLGGGSGGYAAALRAAELGLTVALVEKDKLGGTCLHRGCIPTKALLHSAEVMDTVRSAADVGVSATLEGVDLQGVAKYRDRVVDGLYRGLSGLIRSRKIQVVTGHGTIAAPNTIDVVHPDGTQRSLVGRYLLIATGSLPQAIASVPVDHTTIITSDDALGLVQVPRSALILGGGAIGCEFASIWRAFGCKVTLVEALDRLVPLEEESSSALLQREFTQQGITSVLGRRVMSARSVDDGAEVTLQDGSTLQARVVLVAIGRAPNTAGLGLQEAGVTLDRGYIVVNEQCRTTMDTIFAVGDVIPTLQLAHAGFAEGMLVAEVVAGQDPTPIVYSGVPRVTYSHPEVASVGLTSAAAVAQGHDIKKVTYDLGGNGRARILGASGAVTVIAGTNGPVLGVHMVGERVGDLVSEAQLIVNWEATPSEVAAHVHAHPTLSEALGEAHLALAGKPLHSHA